MNVIEKLKAELKKRGLPEGLAEHLNVTDDSQIEDAVNKVAGLMPKPKRFDKITDLINDPENAELKKQYELELQKIGDKRVSEALKKAQKKAKETDEDDEGDDPLAEMKSVIETLTTEIKSLKSFTTKTGKAEKAKSFFAEKKIPDRYMKFVNLESDDLDGSLKGVEDFYLAEKQERNDLLLSQGIDPETMSKKADEVSDNQAKEFAESRNKSETAGGSVKPVELFKTN